MSGTRAMSRPDEGAVLLKLKYLRLEQDGRVYVRRNGRSIRLRESPGSEAFHIEYARALEATDAPKPEPLKVLPESLAWLVNRYTSSPHFLHALKPSTQAARRRILLKICEQHGHKRFRMMQERHVRQVRDERADSPEVANARLKALRAMFRWAVAEEKASHNPAANVPKLAIKSDGFHTWTEDEVRQYEAYWPPGTKQRLALALLLYAGVRRSDVVRLGRQMIQDGWLTFKAVKNEEVVTIPILPPLAEELAHAPKGQMTFLVTEYGKPFSAAGFGNRFRDWCDKAGLPHCTAHGLRKAASSRLAELGASEKQLNAWFGWADNSNEARRYTKAAQRKRLAEGVARQFSVPRGDDEAKISSLRPRRKRG